MTGFEKKCPVEDIAAYIDGELDAAREVEIEAHFAACEHCKFELNLQKRFLCNVSSGLRHESDIDLPHDFARKVAVNAESLVSGLRRPRERFNAVFICAGLALFALFALGGEATDLFSLAYGLFEKVAAVGSLAGQVLYSFFVGVVIILRTVATGVTVGVTALLAFAAICVAAALRFRRRFVKLLRV